MLKVSEGIPEHVETAEEANEAFPDLIFERFNKNDDPADKPANSEGGSEEGEENVHDVSLALGRLGREVAMIKSAATDSGRGWSWGGLFRSRADASGELAG